LVVPPKVVAAAYLVATPVAVARSADRTALSITVALAVGAIALLAALRAPSSRLLRWSTVAVIAFTPPLVGSAPSPIVSVVMAALVGLGAGASLPRHQERFGRSLVAGILGAGLSWTIWAVFPRWIAVIIALALVLALSATGALPRAARRPTAALGGAVLVLLVVIATSLGATSPRATWFGGGVMHGPRSSNQVALTFDDGPNRGSTLAIRDVLDQYGVKATFFLVGSALDASPDIARALIDDGQLVGSHAYHHNTWKWMSPHYTELSQSLQSMKTTLGVCPRFFRPPHGFRTPFVEQAVADHHMKMVLWNVSAADWATTDDALVASRVLDRARGGSIILLHDGLDGQVNVDRSVVTRALPRIIEGLRARGLEPVRLDTLLGTTPYVADC
jgi:peptidoglycan/xylan/chitin deacetylase (PgdA/CDA1 family)